MGPLDVVDFPESFQKLLFYLKGSITPALGARGGQTRQLFVLLL